MATYTPSRGMVPPLETAVSLPRIHHTGHTHTTHDDGEAWGPPGNLPPALPPHHSHVGATAPGSGRSSRRASSEVVPLLARYERVGSGGTTSDTTGSAAGTTTTCAGCVVSYTVEYDELARHPEWVFLAHSPLIRRGYRPRLTAWHAAASACQWHNETCNIWTHGLGLLALLAVATYLMAAGDLDALAHLVVDAALSPADDDDAATSGNPAYPHGLPIWPAGLYVAVASACMAFSTAFHIFNVVSPRVEAALLKADYFGITLLVGGFSFSVIVYGFWCNPGAAWTYTGVCAACIVLVTALGSMSRFAAPRFAWLRVTAYVLMAIVCCTPVFHLALTQQVLDPAIQRALAILAVNAAQYLLGGVIYSWRWPERTHPRTFDYFSSHTIMHAFIATASLGQLAAVATLHAYRATHNLNCAIDDTRAFWRRPLVPT